MSHVARSWPVESHPRVIAAQRARCEVLKDGVPVSAALRRRAGKPVCGDLVALEAGAAETVISEILPRSSEFARADRSGRRQIIAANVETVVIVLAPEPSPTRDIVNRYLVASELNGCDSLICVNKSDQPGHEALLEELAVVRSLGYRVTATSAKRGEQIDQLRSLLGGINILVGQSGVGKTSLANRLLGDSDLKTDRLSTSTGKGRHTTSRSTLYPLQGEKMLIDSPGVWEYGLWNMPASDIAFGFVEFRDVSGCHFANCSHVHEPGCAVDAAAQEGIVSAERLASYRRIVAQSAA